MKAFTKKDLINKLGYSQEETKIIMEAQKRFPELLTMENDTEGYVIDAYNLWEQLGRPQSEFNKWSKRKILDKGFIEKTDFLLVDKNVELQNGGYKTIKNYKITLDTSKEISMVNRNVKIVK